MNKYEQLIEFIINDEQDKARELFHKIVVEKGTEIYESLIDEQDLEEVGGNPVGDLVDEITVDEQGISEEEEEGEEESGADDLDLDAGEEDHHADVGGEEELEDRVMDLEDALDELKAEFDALMAGEEQEPEHADMFGGEEGAEEVPEEMYEAEHCDEEEENEEEDEEMDESIVREYVEKVADQGQKSEGGEVGKGGSANVNKHSTVAGKNDMGGTAANIAKGGANANPDGQRPHPTASKKGDLIGKVQNTAGGTKNLSSANKAKTAEGSTTDGSVPVHDKSPVKAR